MSAEGSGPGDRSVWREVLQFAVPGFVALTLLAVASFVIAQRVAAEEALRGATAMAEVIARSAIEPLLEASDLQRSVRLSELDALVTQRLLVDPVVAVRLWATDGTVVYASDPRLIGQRFELGADALAILAAGGVEAEVSDLAKPENQYQREFGELVEVYLPVSDGKETTYLLEIYTRQSAINEAAQRIMGAFMPVLVGSLVVLTGILIGLAWRMARRLRADSAHRERLLHRALDSSETERRRIAADLHDGVVQDLAGVTYALTALSDQTPDPALSDRLSRTATTTRGAVRSLRSLLVDIYPASLGEAGLAAALTDLVSALPDGVDATLSVPTELTLTDDAQAALYRAARESLQNVAKHASASKVSVTVVQRADGGARLTVRDDGVGFDPAAVPSGHLGVALLRDLATSVSGEFRIDSVLGSGTTVTFEVLGS